MLEMKNLGRYATNCRIVGNVFYNNSISTNSHIVSDFNIPD